MKYVLITGGTSGIGYELARKFASNHYGIVIVSSSQERLKSTKEKLEKEFSIPVKTYEQDLSAIGAAISLYDKIRDARIEISVLVNNAGFGLAGAAEQIDLQKDESMLVLNMITPVELMKLFLPDMYQRGSGKILNVASTGAFQPGPYTASYHASKVFVLNYSRAVRFEAIKNGVQICVLCPGATKTDFFRKEGKPTPKYAMPAEEVADYAYKRLMQNKEVSIPGIGNRLLKMAPISYRMKLIAKVKAPK